MTSATYTRNEEEKRSEDRGCSVWNYCISCTCHISSNAMLLIACWRFIRSLYSFEFILHKHSWLRADEIFR